MAMYYNGKKVCNLYYNGKCITQLALGKEMTRLVEGDDFVRAEWLCGRNGAYINTNHKLNAFEDSFQIKAKIDDPTAANPSGGENDIFGYMQDNGYRCIAFYARNTGRLFFAYSNISRGGSQVYFANKTDFIATLSADGSNFTATCDGVAQIATVGNLPQGEYGDITIFRFGQILTSADYFHGDISYFNIEPNKVRMTPCRLLRPIPATLDGNGIARNAGDCGMYDAVSGKFYGNVAASGAFTVEPSLVDGVDYERHKWLHFDSNGSANAEFISLPINSSVFDFTRKFIKYDNNSYFWTGSATFSYSCSQNIINVYNFENNTYVYVSNSSLASVNGIVAINSSASSLTFNEEQVPQYDFPIGSIKWRVSSVSDGAIFDTSSITVDGVERYIPVRLLRPLPSYLDANGKERHQFECGMLDLKTMKFYGNVNTSGNFSVSDN